MSADDDSFNEAPTPPRPPSERRMRGLRMSDEARARSHAEWARQRADAPVSGVPVVDLPDDPSRHDQTDPISLWQRDYNDDDREVINRLGLNPDEPITQGQWIKAVNRERRHERRHRDTQQRLANAISELNEKISPDHLEKLDSRIRATEETLKRSEADRKGARRFLYAAILAALGSIGTLGVYLLKSNDQRTGDSIRLQLLEKSVDGLGQDIRDLRRELAHGLGRQSLLEPGFRALDSALQTYASKGTTP